MTDEKRLAAAYEKIDAANAEDPNREQFEGSPQPKELLYGRRMTARLIAFEPDAGVALSLAARAQHIRRWTSPRSSFPMDRIGYLKWRTELKKFHADTTGQILREVGYDQTVVERAQALIRKEGLSSDPETQTLEDVACLVFLEFYFADFAAQHAHEPDKVIDIVKKTWRKMSDRGHAAALQLTYSPEAAALIQTALKS